MKKVIKTKGKVEQILNPKKFKAWLLKNVGKRCKDYDGECFVCRSWHIYDEINSYTDLNDNVLSKL